jgi:hypothetical protein
LADDLRILSGGDQVTGPITIGGHTGLKVMGTYLNVADSRYDQWADDDTIDVLIEVYGDGALFAANGNPRNFNFLIGTLPPANYSITLGGSIPFEARNKKWNWVLFRIANGIRPDGMRFLNAEGGQAGGVNGGTIRMEGVPNLIVRVIAFGEQGAFGEPEQVNLFAPGETSASLKFTDKYFLENGQFRLVMEGKIGEVYRVEKSLDFSNWFLITTQTNKTGTTEATDLNQSKAVRQFYRAVRQ